MGASDAGETGLPAQCTATPIHFTPEGPCDSMGRVVCQASAQDLIDSGVAVATCLVDVPFGTDCVRGSCSTAADAASCRCGGDTPCATNEVCVASSMGATPHCVCAGW